MTLNGGDHADGTIFSINPDGTGFYQLLRTSDKDRGFTGTGGNYPGAHPYGSLTLSEWLNVLWDDAERRPVQRRHHFFGQY